MDNESEKFREGVKRAVAKLPKINKGIVLPYNPMSYGFIETMREQQEIEEYRKLSNEIDELENL